MGRIPKENGNHRFLKIMVVVAVAILLVCLFLYENRRAEADVAERTIQYADNIVIYCPGLNNIALEETSGEIYYNNLLLVFLTEELSDSEEAELAAQVGGEVVGYVSGIMNLLQIKVPETDLDGLDAYCDRLMEVEQVMYATHDIPAGIQETISEDNNPWAEANVLGKVTPAFDLGNEDDPGGVDWWAEAICAYTAWNQYSNSAEDITVGIIDNGFYTKHEDLWGKISILSTSNTPDSHGTHVAGLIAAANNDVGIRGVADQANLSCVDWTGRDEAVSTAGIVAFAVLLLQGDDETEGAKVVNMSFGYTLKSYDQYIYLDGYLDALLDIIFNSSEQEVSEYRDYINNTQANANQSAKILLMALMNLYISSQQTDYLLVQSAGNGFNNGEGPGLPVSGSGYVASITEELYEAVLSELSGEEKDVIRELGYSFFDNRIITVGSVKGEKDSSGNYIMAYYSNYWVDICAPGEKVYSTLKTDLGESKYGTLSGTSMAAPIVSGAAALVWSINPELTAPEVRELLLTTYTTKAVDEDGPLGDNTYPMLNVGAAAKAAYELRANDQEPSEEQKAEAEPEPEEKPQADVAAAFQTYLETVLIPEYGVMDTEYLIGPSDYAEGETRTWTASDLTGLLSASIQDFDGDGQEEMLTVAFTSLGDYYEAADGTIMYDISATYADTIILRVYEYEEDNGVKEAAAKEMMTGSNAGIDAQICVFTYEHDGITYIAIDNYGYDGNSLLTLSTFQYDGSIAYVQGIAYEAYYYGSYGVRVAYEEGENPLSLVYGGDAWEQLLEYSSYKGYGDDGTEMPPISEEELEEYMSLYKDLVEGMGLNVDDARIGMDNNTGFPKESYFEQLISAPDVYTAKDSEITFIAGIYQYDSVISVADVTGHMALYRLDYTGLLDTYR